MINIEDLSVEGSKPFSVEVGPGKSCKVIASSEYQKNLLLATFAGFRKPEGGIYKLFGTDVFSLSEKEHINLFRRVGLIWNQGGLLSNIRVWENILLPLEYHHNAVSADIEHSVLDLLSVLGVEGADAERLLQSTPYTIPVHMKMFIGLIREILLDPEIVIYDSLYDGLERRSVKGLLKLIKGFEEASPERPTLSLSTDERTLKSMESDIVIDLRLGHGDY